MLPIQFTEHVFFNLNNQDPYAKEESFFFVKGLDLKSFMDNYFMLIIHSFN